MEDKLGFIQYFRMQCFFSNVLTLNSANVNASPRNQQEVHHSTPPMLPQVPRVDINLIERLVDPGLR